MNSKNQLYMDIHILQTVPPSCINRDDTGSPKTAFYGGVMRARVSSQAWKKAVRDMFRKEQIFEAMELGIRTKKVVGLLAYEIAKLNTEVDNKRIAGDVLESIKIVKKAADKETNANAEKKLSRKRVKSGEVETESLFFISLAQTKALAKFIVDTPEIIEGKTVSDRQKKQMIEILKNNPAIDIALFGRMVASVATLNSDAAAQVSHSISTHKIVGEYDYFTAVDDIGDDSNAGAGHIGTVEFNSSTLYRYATVALHGLSDHLGKGATRAAQGFIKAFSLSMPTGKQNSFANRTVPYAILVTFRTDQPINLVGAFECPVSVGDAGKGGYEKQSLNTFVEHTKNIYTNWLGAPNKSFVVGNGLDELGEQVSFPNLLERSYDYINIVLSGGENV